MRRSVAFLLRAVTILVLPIAVISLIISRKAVTGNEYAAVVEILGTNNAPGAIQIFGADTQTISNILDWIDTWSLALLVSAIAIALAAFLLSNDRIRAGRQLSLGLFFTFGIWSVIINKSNDVFTAAIGDSISDLSAVVIATYLAALSQSLLNLIGGLALVFGIVALGLWLFGARRDATENLTGN
jgi:uncharacterized membrane protein